MAGLVPAIHALLVAMSQDVDARDERGHHGVNAPVTPDDTMGEANAQGVAPAVSVVVPVRNEAGNVAPLVAEIAAALAGRAFEIAFGNAGRRAGPEAEVH